MEISSRLHKILSRMDSSSSKAFLKVFKPGQTILGKTQEALGGNMYLIKVNGKDIIASSKTTLEIGAKYAFEVIKGDSSSTINLKHVAPDISQEQSVLQLIKELGLQNSETARNIVRMMLDENLPVTSKNYEAVFNAFENQYGKWKDKEDSIKNLKALLFLFRNKAGFTEKNIAVYKTFMQKAEALQNADLKSFPALEAEINKIELISLHNQIALFNTALEQPQERNLEKIESGLLFLFSLLSESELFRSKDNDFLPFFAHFSEIVQYMEVYTNDKSNLNKLSTTPKDIEIDFLIYFEDSSPLHCALHIQNSEMLTLKYYHPKFENLELLKSIEPLAKKSLMKIGHRLISFSYQQASTYSSEYKSSILQKNKHVFRSINLKS